MSNHTNKTNDPTGEVPVPTVRLLLRAIRDAEVVYLTFPRLQHALLVDLRPSDPPRPAVLVAPLAHGPAQHRAALQALRPDLPLSEQIAVTAWGGSTRAFAEQGVLPALLNRLSTEGTPEAMAAFEQLREVERGMGSAAPRPAAPAPTRNGVAESEG